MIAELFLITLITICVAMIVVYFRTDHSVTARPVNPPRPRPTTSPHRRRRPAKRKPVPGPIPGTILAHRPGRCARCKGPILKNEFVYPTRTGGWNCPGCSLH